MRNELTLNDVIFDAKYRDYFRDEFIPLLKRELQRFLDSINAYLQLSGMEYRFSIDNICFEFPSQYSYRTSIVVETSAMPLIEKVIRHHDNSLFKFFKKKSDDVDISLTILRPYVYEKEEIRERFRHVFIGAFDNFDVRKVYVQNQDRYEDMWQFADDFYSNEEFESIKQKSWERFLIDCKEEYVNRIMSEFNRCVNAAGYNIKIFEFRKAGFKQICKIKKSMLSSIIPEIKRTDAYRIIAFDAYGRTGMYKFLNMFKTTRYVGTLAVKEGKKNKPAEITHCSLINKNQITFKRMFKELANNSVKEYTFITRDGIAFTVNIPGRVVIGK